MTAGIPQQYRPKAKDQNIGPYCLGIDVGVGSVGAAVLRLGTGQTFYDDPAAVIHDGVVRLFNVPTAAEERRQYRGMRRNTERTARRLDRVSAVLQDAGFVNYDRHSVPKDLLNVSVIKLRAAASSGRVTLPQLARVFLHLADNRGSSVIRESELDTDEEERSTGEAIGQTRQRMQERGFKTFGQLLRSREKKNLQTRIKPVNKKYEFYPSREMIREEFDIIWQQQARHHPELTPALKERVCDEIFFQRKVTPPPPGKCPYIMTEFKFPKASRLFQIRRIYENVNILRLYNRSDQPLPFSLTDRDKLVDHLMTGQDLNMTEIKNLLGLSRSDKVLTDKEDEKAKKIKGYPFDRLLEDSAALGDDWGALSQQKQDDVLEILATEPDDETAMDSLCDVLGCTLDVARRLVQVPVPTGYGRVGPTATEKLIWHLKEDVIPARVAEDRAGLVHASTPDGVIYEYLPYYGEVLTGETMSPIWVSRYRRDTDRRPHTSADELAYGRVPNPVVHAALNQIRQVVNTYIRKYGKPAEIRIELARDINKSAEKREEATKVNRTNQAENERIRNLLQTHGEKVNRQKIQKVKLWEQQSHQCIYSGKAISLGQLLSGAVQVDHILPRSRTLDDSMGNKVVCFAGENAKKANETPYEAFAKQIDQLEAIKRRAQDCMPEQVWRFRSDAMERFEEQQDFRKRFQTDNAYIARMARRYLACLYGQNAPVTATNGRVVALLRGKWGLSSILDELAPDRGITEKDDSKSKRKNRNDHRHHFLDAIVIACVTRGMIQRIHTEVTRLEEEEEQNKERSGKFLKGHA